MHQGILNNNYFNSERTTAFPRIRLDPISVTISTLYRQYAVIAKGMSAIQSFNSSQIHPRLGLING